MNSSETTRIEIPSPTSVAVVAPLANKVESFDLLSKEENHTSWGTLKPSAKSLRTVNPIRALIDPIGRTIQSGEARGDGKDPISLAVCRVRLVGVNALPFASIPRIHSQCSFLNYLYIHTFVL
jgi:hypothetical protein